MICAVAILAGKFHDLSKVAFIVCFAFLQVSSRCLVYRRRY